jgi:hypothetical protein
VRPRHRELHAAAATEAPEMPDQIIDALMALSLYEEARRAHPLAAWVVMKEQPDYGGKLIDRLVTAIPTACLSPATSARCAPRFRPVLSVRHVRLAICQDRSRRSFLPTA